MNSLKNIENSQDSFIIEQKFYILREYVKMVCNKNINGLIVEGSAGLGKSFNILKSLRESNKEFVYCSGFTTALEFYKSLYENRNKIIFFDDISNILKNETTLELLKACLFSPTEKRLIRYSSSSYKLDIPHEFIFTGGVIFTTNKLNKKQNENLKAVLDRVLYYKVEFSYFDKLNILSELSGLPYKTLTKETRLYIFNYIKQHSNQATENLNFRLLYKLYEIYLYSDSIEKFNKLAEGILTTDETTELILTILDKHSLTKEAEKEFCETTGKSRRMFYYHKSRVQ